MARSRLAKITAVRRRTAPQRIAASRPRPANGGGQNEPVTEQAYRTIEEAILWHGGQGRASRDRFKAMSKEERGKLIDFVKSL